MKLSLISRIIFSFIFRHFLFNFEIFLNTKITKNTPKNLKLILFLIETSKCYRTDKKKIILFYENNVAIN
jgi:hypothetical protein